MECCLCGMQMDIEEAKWIDGECVCEDCYVFERGYL